MASGKKPQSLFAQAPYLKAELARRTVRERISDKLASLVASGILDVGDELPSERELASMFAVSRETVRGAVQTLAAKGIVEISAGRAHARRQRQDRHAEDRRHEPERDQQLRS